MKFLIFFLVTSLYFVSAQAKIQTPPDFLVRPYLYSHGGTTLRLAWSYKAPMPANLAVNAVFADQFASKSLDVHRDERYADGLFTAELPIPPCGFGDNNSYLITGMTTAEAITPIACPGELGNTSKFIFLADTQVDTKEGVLPIEFFVKQIEKNGGANAVIVGGDLVQVGAKFDLWTQFFDVMNPLFKNIVLVPVMGNHEYHGNKNVPAWPHFFGLQAHDAMYTTVIGDTQIFVLNSSFSDDPSLVAREREWLESALAASHDDSKVKWRVVTFHHPPYSKGIMNSPLYPKKEFKAVRDNFVPLFERYHVNLVLNGHVHIFERSERNGIQYLTTGTAAGVIGPYGALNPYEVKSARIRTMVTVETSAQELRATTTDLEGAVVDEISLIYR